MNQEGKATIESTNNSVVVTNADNVPGNLTFKALLDHFFMMNSNPKTESVTAVNEQPFGRTNQ